MKILIIVLIILNILVVYGAERTTLRIGESFLYDGKNITLVNAESRYDVALFCVNGQKGIVSEDSTNNINGVYIELKKLRIDSATVELSYDCEICECGDECNNDVCVGNGEDVVFVEEDQDNIAEVDEPIFLGNGDEVLDEDETVVESLSVGNQGILLAILIISVLVLGVIVLWRRS